MSSKARNTLTQFVADAATDASKDGGLFSESKLYAVDVVVIVFYFIIVLIVGLWVRLVH